jgi:hypothetical protein
MLAPKQQDTNTICNCPEQVMRQQGMQTGAAAAVNAGVKEVLGRPAAGSSSSNSAGQTGAGAVTAAARRKLLTP